MTKMQNYDWMTLWFDPLTVQEYLAKINGQMLHYICTVVTHLTYSEHWQELEEVLHYMVTAQYACILSISYNSHALSNYCGLSLVNQHISIKCISQILPSFCMNWIVECLINSSTKSKRGFEELIWFTFILNSPLSLIHTHILQTC